MTREHRIAQWQAQQDAEDAVFERELEWRQITRRLDALYAAQAAGDGSTYTRQRIGRLEALQQTLMGQPEALGAAA
ncbi:hypothetical protein [Streptomyces sp. S.PNR 29]|uniref:hypothetical protein n=1 Tax=Streptomyces sp. S.PNR 29 TaxID=2973805 RepID=UPI0025AF5292|nr:hypothetical protein [Streptomyces sp. S.PNR 29]MDN0198095.1 hypothetical protein [Streptomyces sp. S.PNR 29]